MTKQSSRNVKRPIGNRQVDLALSSGHVKKKLNIKSASRRLAKTKTRKYLLYALACLATTQVVKFIVDTFIFTGSATPNGLGFLAVFYLQIGLILAAIILLVLGSVTYLRSL